MDKEQKARISMSVNKSTKEELQRLADKNKLTLTDYLVLMGLEKLKTK